MTMLIRDIGKIPYSYTKDNNDLHSSSWHVKDADSMDSRPFLKPSKKRCSSVFSIEEKARSLLSRNQLVNLIYNITEYGSKRNIDIETFVSVILELLDTPEKVRI